DMTNIDNIWLGRRTFVICFKYSVIGFKEFLDLVTARANYPKFHITNIWHYNQLKNGMYETVDIIRWYFLYNKKRQPTISNFRITYKQLLFKPFHDKEIEVQYVQTCTTPFSKQLNRTKCTNAGRCSKFSDTHIML
ncbi:hypothetical protein ACJX0J_029084, partial [Zea mays]